jgi:NADH-quinone oxidoreductase subunit L
MKGLYTFVYNKFYIDEFYDATVVNPVVGGSRVVLWKGIDAGLIDGTVNGIGARARNIGGLLRLMQSGNIRSYATWVLLGSVLVIAVIVGIAGGIR